jgi:hypothetical protein
MGTIFSDIPLWQLIFAASTILIIIIMFIIILVNSSRIKKLKLKYNKFMKGIDNKNLEELVENYMERVEEVYKNGKEIKIEIDNVEKTLIKCVQKVGIVRYNAFDDVGSDLSFVIALMDKNNDGYLLNGIYSRNASTVYAKPLLGAKSKIPLSDEEMRAIETAKKSSAG